MLSGLLISVRVLGAGLIVGLLIGLLQALTQIQEQTVSFVPKLLAMIAALTLAMPWMMTLLIDYVRNLFEGIPGGL